MRQPDARRASADQLRDGRQDVAQRHVLAAQNVALTDTPAVECQQVARRYVIDVYDVESGVDVSRRPTAGGIEHDLTRGRRLDVTRPDRRRGVDDHDRHAAVPRPRRARSSARNLERL